MQPPRAGDHLRGGGYPPALCGQQGRREAGTPVRRPLGIPTRHEGSCGDEEKQTFSRNRSQIRSIQQQRQTLWVPRPHPPALHRLLPPLKELALQQSAPALLSDTIHCQHQLCLHPREPNSLGIHSHKGFAPNSHGTWR